MQCYIGIILLVHDCIPLCITSDFKQYYEIEQKKIGKVARNVQEAKKGLINIIENYDEYLARSQNFLKKFIYNQQSLWNRWGQSIEKVVEEEF